MEEAGDLKPTNLLKTNVPSVTSSGSSSVEAVAISEVHTSTTPAVHPVHCFTATAPSASTVATIAADEYADIGQCCLLAEGFHSDLPEYSKSLMLKPFLEKGALSRWISSTEVILVFPTEQQAQAALNGPRNSLMRVGLLANNADRRKVETLSKGEINLPPCT